jgi:hypothetical protein
VIATLQSGYQPWNLPWITGTGDWWDPGTGITIATGVSSWKGIVSQTNLAQSTGSAQPTLSAGILSFVSASSQFLATGALTINAPYSLIAIVSMDVWTLGASIFDGRNVNTFRAQARTGSPQLGVIDSASAVGNINLSIGSFGIICATEDAAGNATLQLNGGAQITTATMAHNALNGLTVGCAGNGTGGTFLDGRYKAFGFARVQWTSDQCTQTINAANRRYGVF